MKKTGFIAAVAAVLFAGLSVNTYAQERLFIKNDSASITRTITVKGVGHASAAPDMAVVSMSITSLDKNYEKALRDNAEKVRRLEEAIIGCGLPSDALTTSNFNIYPQNESKRINDTWTDVFVGYNCTQNLSISFDFDKQLIGRVLGAIASCNASPSFSISFKIKNPDEVKEAVLKDAVENAKEKAKIICDASGMTLRRVVSINYNFSKTEYLSRSNYTMALKAAAVRAEDSIDTSFNPEDIKVSDEVTIVWEIR